jgi:radical SAM protein with 4Fe4S-binding SPASM domain
MVTLDNSEFQEFIQYINTQKLSYKIGFDSCTIPALINNLGDIDPDSLDTCEGARWSAYITPDMKMLPCSFDNQKQRWAVDLRKYSIKEAWDSDVFENFRNHFKSACPDCSKRRVCMGGCPITPEVVLCRNAAVLAQ